MSKYKKIKYNELNARQKESYNFHKVAAVLAEFGFSSMWLNDDWQGADFIAVHLDGETFLRVQLKGRLTFDRKYDNKDIYIAFYEDKQWYLYPHDELRDLVLEEGKMAGSKSWDKRGGYSWPKIPKNIRHILERYKI